MEFMASMSWAKVPPSSARHFLPRFRRNGFCQLPIRSRTSCSNFTNQSTSQALRIGLIARIQQCRHNSTVSTIPPEPAASIPPNPSASSQQTPPPPPPRKPRILRYTLITLLAFTLGFSMSASPAIQTILEAASPPTDADTLTLFTPEPSSQAAHINAAITSHPYTQTLLDNPTFLASRPHLKIPPSLRPQNLTAGTLLTPQGLSLPPLAFTTADGSEFVSFNYVGPALCGHPGIIHGGLSATLLDEGLARCCFPALPNKVGVTASLKIEYKRPVRAGQVLVLRARTVKVDGRKAWVEGRLETVPGLGPEEVGKLGLNQKEGDVVEVPQVKANGTANGVEEVKALVNGLTNGANGTNEVKVVPWEEQGPGGEVLVTAEALFIEPRQAASMKRLYAS